MITRDSIQKLIEYVPIEQEINDYVKLKKRGSNYIGLCPFHNEKTPSFSVSASKGIYKCFGCGKAGNVINFLMEHEHFSYPEAVKHLAEKYNIEIEETGPSTPEEDEAAQMRESLYLVNQFANQFYQDELWNTEDGKSIGLSYFKERGFSEETIKNFQLGYCPRAESKLLDKALQEGYKKELLMQLGLVRERNGREYDFFRDRVQFPIHNLSGKVIGFGARTLLSDKKIPKYVNSPESEIYHKSKILYGFFQAKKAIRKEEQCILVEGYTDVISLHQAGIENIVASSGTSLTEDQVRLVKRYTPNILMLFDGDAAGIKAALRGVDIVLEQGLNVKIVVLPEGEDPDSFVKQVGHQGMLEYISENAKEFILFKAAQLLADAGMDVSKRAEAMKDIIQSIVKIPDPISRTLYVRESSRILDIPEQILVTELNKQQRYRLKEQTRIDEREARALDPTSEAPKAEPQTELRSGTEWHERDIIRLLLECGTHEVDEERTVQSVVIENLDGFPFASPRYMNILSLYEHAYKENRTLNSDEILHHENPEIRELAIAIMYSPHELSENWLDKHEIEVTDKNLIFQKDMESALARFKLRKLLIMKKELEDEVKSISDVDELKVKIKKLDKMRKAIAKLCKVTGTVIVR